MVGTGIQIVGQTTLEARDVIRRAEKVLHVVADDATASWLKRLNPSAESLYPLYRQGKPRAETYEAMVEAVLSLVRKGMRVCFASYGHPGVFDYSSHESIRRARNEGYRARMLPGISAEDCLLADLGVDPGVDGCQSYEATDFLLRRRRPDTTVPLILWQIGVIGQPGHVPGPTTSGKGLALLAEVLREQYGGDHGVTVYRTSLFPGSEPSVNRLTVAGLADATVEKMATLFVPPLRSAPVDPAMAERLGVLRA